MRFDWKDVSKKDKQARKYKEVSNVTVAGRSCERFELKDRNIRCSAGFVMQ